MSNQPTFQFTASIPSNYEEILVPRLFRPLAQLLIERIDVRSGERVIDIATGPGTVAVLAAERTGERGKVTAVDVSPPMLAIARSKPAAPHAAPIEYIEANAMSLPVPDESFDVALCQHGLQFVPDRGAAVAEIRRALTPGGRAILAVWGAIGESPFFSSLHALVREYLPVETADVMLAGFSYPHIHEFEALLRAAQFSEVHVAPHHLEFTFEDGPRHALRFLEATPIAAAAAARSADLPEKIAVAAEERFAPLVRGRALVSTILANIAIVRR